MVKRKIMNYERFDSNILCCDVFSYQFESEQDIDNFFQKENKKKQLLVVKTEHPLREDFVQFYDGKFMTKNITLSIDLSHHLKEPRFRCSFYQHQFVSKQLYELSLFCGLCSRYNIDDMIEREQYESLYHSWIENDVSRSRTQILVHKGGFISYHILPSKAKISLLSVHPNSRSQGVASQLIQTCLQDCHARGIRRVSVVTQGNNRPAISLYKKRGFKEEKNQLIYHFWNNC